MNIMKWVKERVSEPSSWLLSKRKRGYLMPRGPGTYGSKRGRPPKKKKLPAYAGGGLNVKKNKKKSKVGKVR